MSRTTAVLAAGLALCALSVLSLQQRFDAGDHAKAERLVRGLAAAGRSERFDAFVAARANHGRPGTWTSDITGGCRGIVEVRYRVPGEPAAAYAWDVDLPAQAVHPTRASPRGEQLLGEFAGPGATPR